jgi:hypothetical protein
MVERVALLVYDCLVCGHSESLEKRYARERPDLYSGFLGPHPIFGPKEKP